MKSEKREDFRMPLVKCPYLIELNATVGDGELYQKSVQPTEHTRGVEVDELLAVAVFVIVEGRCNGPGVGRRRPATRLAEQSAADPASPDYDACNETDEITQAVATCKFVNRLRAEGFFYKKLAFAVYTSSIKCVHVSIGGCRVSKWILQRKLK